MKKSLILIFLFAFSASFSFAQREKKMIIEGNEKYKAEEYSEAERLYNESIEENITPEGLFNLGDALYRQGNFEKAADAFSRIIDSDDASPELKSKAYHNLGNVYVSQQELEKGVNAYKDGLRLNPKDEDTRYNLSYAMRQMKEQQEQEKQQNQEGEDGDEGEEGEKQDGEGDENQEQEGDQQQQGDEQQDGEGDEQEGEQSKPGEGDKKEGERQQQAVPNEISKEDAARILNSLNRNEQQLQEKIRDKKKSKNKNIDKDW